MGPDGLRCLGGGRRRHFHGDRVHRGQHHRPCDLGVVHLRRGHLRAGRAVLRRVRLDSAGRGQRLHLLLRHLRRVHRLDHRLGPDPGVRGRRRPWWPRDGRGISARCSASPAESSRSGSVRIRLGRTADRRRRAATLPWGTKLSQVVGRSITAIKVAVVLLVVIVGAFYIKAANYSPFIPPAETAATRRLGGRPVAVLVADRRRG